MDFILRFCRQGPKAVNFGDLTEWAKEKTFFSMPTQNKPGYSLVYRNPDTEVTFEIRRAFSDKPLMSLPDGYLDAEISFSIAKRRPSFFAYEAMPIVTDLMERFSLSLLNEPNGSAIQAGADSSPETCFADDLVVAWKKANQTAVAAYCAAGNKTAYMQEARATAMWRYMKDRQRFRKEFGQGIHVPKILALQAPAGDVVRAISWPKCIPVLFADAELVVMNRLRRRLLGLIPRVEVGYVDAGKLQRKIAPFLVLYGLGMLQRLLLNHEIKEVQHAYRTVALAGDLDEYTCLPPDQFVDVRP